MEVHAGGTVVVAEAEDVVVGCLVGSAAELQHPRGEDGNVRRGDLAEEPSDRREVVRVDDVVGIGEGDPRAACRVETEVPSGDRAAMLLAEQPGRRAGRIDPAFDDRHRVVG